MFKISKIAGLFNIYNKIQFEISNETLGFAQFYKGHIETVL